MIELLSYLQIVMMNNSTDTEDFSEYNQVCLVVIYLVIVIKQSPSSPVQKIITSRTL